MRKNHTTSDITQFVMQKLPKSNQTTNRFYRKSIQSILLLFIFLISVCKVSAQTPNPQFSFGTATAASTVPFNTTSLHNQFLYFPADLGNPGSNGTITKIFFKGNTASSMVY